MEFPCGESPGEKEEKRGTGAEIIGEKLLFGNIIFKQFFSLKVKDD